MLLWSASPPPRMSDMDPALVIAVVAVVSNLYVAYLAWRRR